MANNHSFTRAEKSPSLVKRATTAADFALQVGTALLMVFAVTLALVRIEAFLLIPRGAAEFMSVLF